MATEISENIENIIRYDIKDDLLSNPSGIANTSEEAFKAGDDGPHFDLARPGSTLMAPEKAVKKIKADGVKNRS